MARSHTLSFRATFHVQHSYSFALAKFDGENNTHMLARGWVEKLSFFYRVWKIKGQPHADFTADEVRAFVETDEWLRWAIALDNDSASYDEVLRLRRYVPVM